MLIVYPNNFSFRELKLSWEKVFLQAPRGKGAQGTAWRPSYTKVCHWGGYKVMSGPMLTRLLLSLTLCLDKLRCQPAHLLSEDLSCVLPRPCLKPQPCQGTRLCRLSMKTQQRLQSFWSGSGLCSAEAKCASEETCFVSSCFICRCWKGFWPFRKYTTNWTRILFPVIWLAFPPLSIWFDSTLFKRNRYTKKHWCISISVWCEWIPWVTFPREGWNVLTQKPSESRQSNTCRMTQWCWS